MIDLNQLITSRLDPDNNIAVTDWGSSRTTRDPLNGATPARLTLQFIVSDAEKAQLETTEANTPQTGILPWQKDGSLLEVYWLGRPAFEEIGLGRHRATVILGVIGGQQVCYLMDEIGNNLTDELGNKIVVQQPYG